jgi:hypothetical protein
MDLLVSTNLGSGGHEDLFLTIPLIGLKVSADTYYFALALEEVDVRIDENEVKRGVLSLLTYWADKALACGNDEVIHLPFDFSDQYIGCIQLVTNDARFRLSYGFTHTPGYSVNPLELGDFCQQVSDFQKTSKNPCEVSRQDFQLAIDDAIVQIEKDIATPH